MEEVKLLLVGVGGYGSGYVQEILNHPERRDIRLVGVVDPYVADSRFYGELRALDLPFYDTIEDFYEHGKADLAVISTPIQFHAHQAIHAMQHGSHALLEKPAAATAADVRAMIEVRDRTQRMMAIGFQWCYDRTMLRLKADVDAGALGRPVRMRAMVLWPRDIAYYKRGLGWAGKKYDGAGRPVFDSVAANATAHYLENMLWLAGCRYQGSEILRLSARTARANDIETYDTILMSAELQNGAELFFAASHAIGAGNQQEPMFEYAFEKAVVRFGGYGDVGGPITAIFADGTIREYGVSEPGGLGMTKLWTMVDAINGRGIIPCPAEAALSHAVAMEMVMASCPEAEVFPPDMRRLDSGMVWVPGLKDALVGCYAARTVPDSIIELV